MARSRQTIIFSILFIGLLAWPHHGLAQTFSSGSTGADGAFAPTATLTVPLPSNGVFNYTTVTIPSGVTVAYTPNAANTPVTILATGNISIAGTITVNGASGAGSSTTGPVQNLGGAGGPGGFAGGNGGPRGGGFGTAGLGIGGGAPATTLTGPTSLAIGGVYGAPAGFTSLIPLFGGSGGGGGLSFVTDTAAASGGGGGGAILMASSTSIALSGTVTANGGSAPLGTQTACAAGGSGGAIKLVAPVISGTGTLRALLGTPSNCSNVNQPSGIIALNGTTLSFSGSSSPAAVTSLTLGPVTPTSTPALINVPTVSIQSVGGQNAPVNPTASYSTADVTLPPATTNPVPVTVVANNIPIGTSLTVKVSPANGAATTFGTSSTTNFASSVVTANVTLPSGSVSVLHAFGTFTLPPQVARLFPLIDGEAVDQVLVAGGYGAASTMTLVSVSGKSVPFTALSLEDQQRAEQAFTALGQPGLTMNEMHAGS